MTKDDKLKSPSRRNFLRGAGTGVVGAASVGLAAPAAVAKVVKDDHTAGDYQETDHVKTAYRLARF